MGHNKYQVTWANGSIEIVEGTTFLIAMVNAGHGRSSFDDVGAWEKLPIDDE